LCRSGLKNAFAYIKHSEIIADNPSKAGWNWGCVSAIDSRGQTIWIADAHRGDGKRFVVRADEKLTFIFHFQITLIAAKKSPR
jgi:hypothetical protein